jgi:hypothetical protein
MTEPIVKAWKIRSSSVPTWLGLILGSWFGLIWGSILPAPIGVGFGVAAGSLLGGFLAVPIWGTFWGLIGLGGQRNGAVRRHGITLLKEDDPLSQRVYVLAAKLGLPHRPWVGTMPHNNAYAIGSGPHNALVVIGQPLLNKLTDAEVDAIIGHELGHVANNDMRRMGLAYSFQNALVWYLRVLQYAPALGALAADLAVGTLRPRAVPPPRVLGRRHRRGPHQQGGYDVGAGEAACQPGPVVFRASACPPYVPGKNGRVLVLDPSDPPAAPVGAGSREVYAANTVADFRGAGQPHTQSAAGSIGHQLRQVANRSGPIRAC